MGDIQNTQLVRSDSSHSLLDYLHDTDALLLDAMGTLIELDRPVIGLQTELKRRYGLELEEAAVAEAFETEVAHYLANHLRGTDLQALYRLRLECARVLRDALPAEAGDIATEQLLELLLAALRFRVIDGVTEALNSFRVAELKTVVVSNWDCSLLAVLASCGLLPLLDGVVTSADVGVAKPGREPFDRALALLAVSSKRAVHVGNSRTEDVAGGRAAGIRTVLVSGDIDRPVIDHGVLCVHSLHQLASLL